MGTRFEASTVDEESVRAYRGKETAKTDKILQEYLSICLKKGVCTKRDMYIWLLCFLYSKEEIGLCM